MLWISVAQLSTLSGTLSYTVVLETVFLACKLEVYPFIVVDRKIVVGSTFHGCETVASCSGNKGCVSHSIDFIV